MAATTSGSVGSAAGALPSAKPRSFGPMKMPSSPSTAQIASTAASPAAVSTIARRTMVASARSK